MPGSVATDDNPSVRQEWLLFVVEIAVRISRTAKTFGNDIPCVIGAQAAFLIPQFRVPHRLSSERPGSIICGAGSRCPPKRAGGKAR